MMDARRLWPEKITARAISNAINFCETVAYDLVLDHPVALFRDRKVVIPVTPRNLLETHPGQPRWEFSHCAAGTVSQGLRTRDA